MGWKWQKYTSTTAITAPASFMYVSGCAGGSGGGGGDPTPGGGGGGGCAGQAASMVPLYCVTGETLTITVGAGGAGGAVSGNGGLGGNSSVAGSTSGGIFTLYAAKEIAYKANGTSGGVGGGWQAGAGIDGGTGGANGVNGGNNALCDLTGLHYRFPIFTQIAKFSSGAGGGGLNASGGLGFPAKNWTVALIYGAGGGAAGGGGGAGGGTPWGKGGAGGSNGAAGSAPAAGEYGAGGGGGSGNSAGGAGSPGGLWLIWFDDADLLNILTSTLTLAGSIGKLIADNLNATISSRSTYGGSDTAGTTTLLTRVVGTLATGTHNPQSGDAYARLGAPSGASVVADIATRLATSGYTAPDNAGITTIKAKTDNLPADTNTLLTSTGIKVASIANGVIAAATFAAGALDAVWSTASRTLTAISDSAGVTTLLSRIIGTLSTGTHQPQSGDAYARLGTPAGASMSADVAAIDAAVSGLHDFDPATDVVAHVTLVDTVTTLTNSPDVPTEAEIADAVRVELAPELASITAMEERMEEQVPSGPVVVVEAPPAETQTTAWTICYGPDGSPEQGVVITITAIKVAAGDGAFDSTPVTITSDATGLAQGQIPRGAGLGFTAKRGTTGTPVRFSGVDAETLELPAMLGAP